MALLVLGAGCRWLGVPALPALGVSCLLISQIAFTSRTKKQHKQPQIASRKSAQAEELPGSRKKESALKEKERVMERAKERGGGLE